MAVADRVTVLRGGKLVATVEAADATPRSLAALMVGREIDAARRRRERRRAATSSSRWRGSRPPATAAGDALKDVSLAVRAGEMLGIAGVAGNGQRELAEAVTGMRDRHAGTSRVAGGALATGDPRAAISAGIAHVPGGPAAHGLAPSLSIAANPVLKTYRDRTSRGPLLRLRRIRDEREALIERYDVKAPGPETPARQPLGRQPPEGRARARVLGRAPRSRRRGADPWTRRRRHRDRPRLSARGRGERSACS